MPKSEQGISRKRYAVIPRTLIFLVRKDKVLLLRGSEKKRIWANLYNGVGGHIEKGEDFLSAGRRELLEETGLEVAELVLCGEIMVDVDEDLGIAFFILKGQSDDGDPRPSEEGTLEWISMDDFKNFPLVEDLPVLLPRVFSFKQGDPVFSGRYHYDQNEKLIIEFGK